ncbi:MAG: hypothetical protein JNK15_20205 [Planctomycetes bacterium]|nr:hypothetical protein [Planctomycetota bacterium]
MLRPLAILFVSLLGGSCQSPAPQPASSTDGKDLQVQVLPLQHTPAAAMADRLAAEFGNRGADGSPLRIVAHSSGNAVVVSGTAAQIQDAVAAVARLDVAPGR